MAGHETVTSVEEVETPGGSGRLHLSVPSEPVAALILGAGASGQIETPDLDALATGLPLRGVAVGLFELPWRVAGRRMGPRPPASDPLWNAGVDRFRDLFDDLPLFTGGRSAGARIACRTWGPGIRAVVALSFPLHPPGRPEVTRAPELGSVAAPVLLLSGTRDPFGSPAEWAEELRVGEHLGPRRWLGVEGAAHTYRARDAASLVEAVAAFCL